MDVETIITGFAQKPPRKVCLKRDSPEEGYGFHPFSHMGELAGCGSIILAILLLLALVVGQGAFLMTKLVAWILTGLAILLAIHPLIEARKHKRLARYGAAVIGHVTSCKAVEENYGSQVSFRRVTIGYEFRIPSGELITGTRDKTSDWYEGLEQDGPVVIIYMPDRPSVHEPYNGLRYRIRM